MFNFRKKEMDNNIYAPVTGTCIALNTVPDDVFASGAIGEGVAFTYDGSTVYAPCNGTIIMIANTKHAFGIRTASGAEIMVHIGLDTVELNGQGFEVLVSVNDKVKKGDPVINIDRKFMEAKNIVLTTPLVVTNSSEFTLKTSCVDEQVIKGENAVIQLNA